MDKWKIIGWFIVVSFLLESCSPGQESSKPKEMTKEEEIISLAEITAVFHEKEILLLSVKYKIDEKVINDLLIDWNEIVLSNPLEIDNEKRVARMKKHRDHLSQLSQKYFIPIETIASILIDYENLQRSEK